MCALSAETATAARVRDLSELVWTHSRQAQHNRAPKKKVKRPPFWQLDCLAQKVAVSGKVGGKRGQKQAVEQGATGLELAAARTTIGALGCAAAALHVSLTCHRYGFLSCGSQPAARNQQPQPQHQQPAA